MLDEAVEEAKDIRSKAANPRSRGDRTPADPLFRLSRNEEKELDAANKANRVLANARTQAQTILIEAEERLAHAEAQAARRYEEAHEDARRIIEKAHQSSSITLAKARNTARRTIQAARTIGQEVERVMTKHGVAAGKAIQRTPQSLMRSKRLFQTLIVANAVKRCDESFLWGLVSKAVSGSTSTMQ